MNCSVQLSSEARAYGRACQCVCVVSGNIGANVFATILSSVMFCHRQFGPGANFFPGILLWDYQYLVQVLIFFLENIALGLPILGPGANLLLGILPWEHQHFAKNIDIPGLKG